MINWWQYNLARACMYTLLLALVLHNHVGLADYERTCDHTSRPHPNGLCGSRVNEALSEVCQENSADTRKRHLETQNDESLRDIMLNKKDALSYLVKRQATGTIVCECCYNTCRLAELLQYCNNLPRGRRSA